MSENTQNYVNSVRQRLVDKFQTESSDYDQRDRQLVDEEYFVDQFVIEKQRIKVCDSKIVEECVQAIDDYLKWRKSIGINDLKVEHFPRAMFDNNYMTIIDTIDSKQSKLIYFRIVAHKKVNGWSDVLFRQQMFAIEYIRKRFGNRPFRVIADVSDLPFGGADIQMGLKVMPLVMRHFPGKNTIDDLELNH